MEQPLVSSAIWLRDLRTSHDWPWRFAGLPKICPSALSHQKYGNSRYGREKFRDSPSCQCLYMFMFISIQYLYNQVALAYHQWSKQEHLQFSNRFGCPVFETSGIYLGGAWRVSALKAHGFSQEESTLRYAGAALILLVGIYKCPGSRSDVSLRQLHTKSWEELLKGGKLVNLELYGKSTCFMGKLTINGQLWLRIHGCIFGKKHWIFLWSSLIAVLNYQRVCAGMSVGTHSSKKWS